MVKFSGVLKDAAGKPHTGIVGITFAIYAESSGGAPLWQETQNVQLDQQGRYAVFLGGSTPQGIPQELFASAEPRWLSVQAQLPEENERPRVLLVSVPYALQAENAETLGGLPPSAFVRVAPTSSSQKAIVADAAAITSSQTIVTTATVAPASGKAQTPATAPVNSSVPNATARATAKPTPNVLYADQFSGGVADAINACPSPGCIIYADSQNVNRNLGTIDPGSKAITLY